MGHCFYKHQCELAGPPAGRWRRSYCQKMEGSLSPGAEREVGWLLATWASSQANHEQ